MLTDTKMTVVVYMGMTAAPAIREGLLAAGRSPETPVGVFALMLAVFAILFGARRVDATERHHGMMLAIALESVIKLVAMVAVSYVNNKSSQLLQKKRFQ